MARFPSLALAVCLALSASNPSSINAFSLAPSTGTGRSSLNVGSLTFVGPNTSTGVRTSASSSRSRLCMADGDESSKSKLTRLPESAVEITLIAPGAATKAAYDKAAMDASKSVTIPGFRKGSRIPPQVLENAMAGKGGRNMLKSEAINALLGILVEPALKNDHGLEPIGQPSLVGTVDDIAGSFKPGEDLELIVKCDVWPDIAWKDAAEGQESPYTGLKGSYKRKPFNQAKMDIALKDLRDRYATLSVMEDDQPLAMGDACVVNMEGYMAQEDGVTKGDPLPDAASGDNVEVILGDGRYMTGLVEGLIGAKVGDSREVTVTFPPNLKDKTLAGKTAIFDVIVQEASHRSIPDVDDEFADEVRKGMTADELNAELRKAIDEEDAKEFVPDRNKAIADALADRLVVEVPDTLVTSQAREKFAMMMTEMRDGGVPDEEIKKQITGDNFLKYKALVKDDVIKDFRVSMATDEIARLEGIEIEDYQVEEQMQALKKEAADDPDFDENQVRGKVETTIMRSLVMDFLSQSSDLVVEFADEDESFDEELMERLAKESLEREEADAAKAAAEEATA